MKNVEKDADYHKNKPDLLSRFMKSLKKYVPEECSCIEITNNAYFCGNRILIYVFHTHFVRGAKVRLFVRHNGLGSMQLLQNGPIERVQSKWGEWPTPGTSGRRPFV